MTRFCTSKRVALAGAAVLAMSASVLPAAQAVPGAPARLQVARAGADSTDLQITWSAVAGIDHYTVNVFDGTTDNATVVPSTTTAFVYDGTSNCTRYRVSVSAVKADGTSASTNQYWVPALAPGSVSGLSWSGKGDELPSTLSWAPPTIRSEKPPTHYDVRVTALAGGKVLVNAAITQTSIGIPGLAPNRLYKARVEAVNEFGTCASPTLLLRGAKTTMTPPRKITAVRDSAVPATVRVSWQAPEWTGSNTVTGYEVAYSTSGKTNWTLATDTSTELSIDPTKDWDFAVRAVGSGKASALSKPFTLFRLGGAGTPELDPAIDIKQSGARAIVTIDGPVGSNTKYPKLTVAIAPTMDGKGLRDKHTVSNRATKVVFGDVPCGVYTVLVTGQGAAGAKEFGRSILDLCDGDLMKAADWKLVGGKAEITGSKVFINYGSRVLSVRPRTSQDMVFASDVDFEKGNGWGVYTRSVWEGGHVTTGYSFQYDTGIGNKFIIRLWSGDKSTDKECGTPIAQTKFPTGMSAFGKHRVVMVVSGDSLYATVDGIRMFDVASLTKAITDSKCAMAVPNGTQVALRTWSSDTLITFTDTTLR
jgi:hypothetical protein